VPHSLPFLCSRHDSCSVPQGKAGGPSRRDAPPLSPGRGKMLPMRCRDGHLHRQSRCSHDSIRCKCRWGPAGRAAGFPLFHSRPHRQQSHIPDTLPVAHRFQGVPPIGPDRKRCFASVEAGSRVGQIFDQRTVLRRFFSNPAPTIVT
jgi:hypothetical protein